MPVKKKAAKRTTRKATTRKTTVAKKTVKKATKKTAAKKTVKRAAAKKTTAKAKSATAFPAVKAFKEPLKGSEFYKRITELTEVPVKDVKQVFAATEYLMACSLKKRSCSEFTLPKMLKLTVRVRPARPKGKGINPFTGEPMIIKARPATRIVKARILKKVKDMAEA